MPVAEIEDAAEVAVAYEDMWSRLRGIPGVTSVGAASGLTMGGGSYSDVVVVEDTSARRREARVRGELRT